MRFHRSLAVLAAASLATTLTATAVAADPGKGHGSKSFTLEEATIADIQSALADRSLTCEQLIGGYLKRIAAYEGNINSLITLSSDAAAQAKALDKEFQKRKGRVGPLFCIPVVLKDNIETADMPTTGGSLALAGDIPHQDATITADLRAAGALILGKGNMDEWAHGGLAGYSSVNGQTINPYDPALSPGGSSGGPAAAVAANFTVLGVGSDTLGSLRAPANAESLVAVKPTMGLVSGAGIIPFALTFDVAGPLTRTVTDSAKALNVLAGVDPADPRTAAARHNVPKDYTRYLSKKALKGVRVGVLRSYVSAEDTPMINAALADMAASGAKIVDGLQVPPSMAALQGQYYTFISETEFKTQLGEYLTTRRPEAPVQSHADVLAASEQPGFPIAPAVLSRLRSEATRGSMDDPAYKTAAAEGPAAMRAEIDKLLKDNKVDVLVYGAGSGSAMASLSGYPTVQVPAGLTASGASHGVAFLGQAFTEGPLLGYAYAYEQVSHARITPAGTPPLAPLPVNKH